MSDTQYASAVEILIGGTVDTFLVCAGAGSVVARKSVAQAKTLLDLSGTNTGDQTTVSGNAGSATVLQTARTINGVSFDGSANITVTAAGSTLSDTVPVSKGGTGLTALGSALQVLRVNAGATALEYAAAAGGSPGGSSGQIQYNDAGAFGGATAIVYAGTGTHHTITCQAAGTVGAVIRAHASQTANRTEWQNGASVVNAIVNAAGEFSNPTGGANCEEFGAGAVAVNQGFAIGKGATASGTYFPHAVGNTSQATAYANTAIGYNTRATADYSQAFGCDVYASGINSTAIGNSTNAAHNYCTLIGGGVVSTAANQFIAGSGGTESSNVYFGKGVVHATPTAYTINGTGGSGTNIAGAPIKIAGGKGTGTGVGGSVVLQAAPAGASGSSANALVDVLTADSAKLVACAGQITAVAGIACGPVTFAVLNAMTATVGLGLYRITDRANRLAYPDGTNWRFVADDVIIT